VLGRNHVCRPCNPYKYKFKPILYRVMLDNLLLRIGWRFIPPASPEASPCRGPKHSSKGSVSVSSKFIQNRAFDVEHVASSVK
jgi:hypothetical protein